jgi:phosphoglycolate phosphatase
MDEYEERKYECSLYSYLIPTIKKFKENGIRQSLVSAYKMDKLKDMINKFGLDEYLEHVVGLDNIYAASKAHLAKELVKILGNGHGETLMIGDTVHDYDVACEVGADCILIADGHQSIEILKETGTEVFNSLGEFYDFYFNSK